MKVYDFEAEKLERTPHLAGKAICLGCSHTWEAAAPRGVTVMECPSCHLFKGAFKHAVEPTHAWQCQCGNYLFFVTRDEALCALCGISQNF